jgi:hypothetical protein
MQQINGIATQAADDETSSSAIKGYRECDMRSGRLKNNEIQGED